MSNNNYSNNFQGSFTFHGNYLPMPPPNFSIPPPPPPPPVLMLPSIPVPLNIQAGVHKPPFVPPISDQNFVKKFEKLVKRESIRKPRTVSISIVREKFAKLVQYMEDLKKKEGMLKENVQTLSEEEWNNHMEEIEEKKTMIKRLHDFIGNSCFDKIGKLLAQRASKRLRMKKVKIERVKEKQERKNQMEERSRQIDENLKKFQENIEKTKQEAEAKLHADVIFKEVVRKKTDAKKFITKLDALLRLRRARLNTAKGRGEAVSENEMAVFEKNIDELKRLWSQKLVTYEKEESDLRATLKQGVDEAAAEEETDKKVLNILTEWRELLFGDRLPQVNFKGDIGKFVSVRSSWDQFACAEGSALPMGWVLPQSQG